MEINTNHYVELLIRNREIFFNLLAGMPKEAVLWKPEPAKWCMLEVLCHLVDEEKEDFRARLKRTLEDPGIPYTPIDPESWVSEHKYIEQDCEKKLKEFLYERDKSVSWLQSLISPNWENTTVHHTEGPLSAGKLLINWIAHDYFHIRQLIRLKYGYLKYSTGMDLSYAGKW
jgi:hypothetical protein